jgi:hypothetical protein
MQKRGMSCMIRASIAVTPPGGGVMPVIPPPGTPGGDPYIVPK